MSALSGSEPPREGVGWQVKLARRVYDSLVKSGPEVASRVRDIFDRWSAARLEHRRKVDHETARKWKGVAFSEQMWNGPPPVKWPDQSTGWPENVFAEPTPWSDDFQIIVAAAIYDCHLDRLGVHAARIVPNYDDTKDPRLFYYEVAFICPLRDADPNEEQLRLGECVETFERWTAKEFGSGKQSEDDAAVEVSKANTGGSVAVHNNAEKRADLSTWFESLNKLRAKFETESLACPRSTLCLWEDDNFSTEKPTDGLSVQMRLSEMWVREGYGHEQELTQVPRLLVSGFVSTYNFGRYTWWLMNENVARVAQEHGQICDALGNELERAREIEQTFINLAEYGADLLRRIPDVAKMQMKETATGCRLWVLFLFDIAGNDASYPRLSYFLPDYVPLNCRGPFGLGLLTLKRNPFLESVAAIDSLVDTASRVKGTESDGNGQIVGTIAPEFRTRAMTKRKAAGYLRGGNSDSAVEWLNNCIGDGTISCETLSRQSHVFDWRQFPESVRKYILPN
jgi:hypothetical protein